MRQSSRTAARAAAPHLHGRTLDGAIGTEHAAVARLGAQHRLAALALVEELTGIGWHDLPLGVTALWTSQHRLKRWNVRCHWSIVDGLLASVVALILPQHWSCGRRMSLPSFRSGSWPGSRRHVCRRLVDGDRAQVARHV